MSRFNAISSQNSCKMNLVKGQSANKTFKTDFTSFSCSSSAVSFLTPYCSCLYNLENAGNCFNFKPENNLFPKFFLDLFCILCNVLHFNS